MTREFLGYKKTQKTEEMQTQVKHKGEKNKDRKCKSGQDTRGIKLRKKNRKGPHKILNHGKNSL